MSATVENPDDPKYFDLYLFFLLQWQRRRNTRQVVITEVTTGRGWSARADVNTEYGEELQFYSTHLKSDPRPKGDLVFKVVKKVMDYLDTAPPFRFCPVPTSQPVQVPAISSTSHATFTDLQKF